MSNKNYSFYIILIIQKVLNDILINITLCWNIIRLNMYTVNKIERIYHSDIKVLISRLSELHDVFQVSGDERKRLCEHVKPCDSGLTVYGSLTYQLNHANMESTGIFDFIIKALSIIHRTGEFHKFTNHQHYSSIKYNSIIIIICLLSNTIISLSSTTWL